MLFKSKHPELGIKLKCYYVQVSEFYGPQQNPKVRSLLKQICIFRCDLNLCGTTISSLMKNDLAAIID